MIFVAADPRIEKWVASKIPAVGDKGFGPCQAVGIIGKSGAAVCGIVYHDYQPQCGTVQVSFASSNPVWARKRVVAKLLYTPFVTWGVGKVWAAIPHTSDRTIRLAIALGFRKEATLRRQFGDAHAVIVGMLNHEYQHKYGEYCHVPDAKSHAETGLAA